MPQDAYGGVMGLSDTMSPGSISRLSQSDAIAFRAKFEGERPPNSELYWRGPVLWHFDGQTWRAADPRLRYDIRYQAEGSPIDYEVTLEPHNRHWLYALDLPGRLPANARATTDYQLISLTPVRTRMRYEMRSYPKYRATGGSERQDLAEALALPEGFNPRALRLARDTGVLVELLPEFGPSIGFDQESRYHDLTVDEHTFAVVQAAADNGFSLPVRLAALFHDLGKPIVGWRGHDGRLHYYAKPGFASHGHDQVGADLASGALLRLRYPNALRRHVVRIVRRHMFQPGKGDARRARRFLRRNGDELAFDLIDHKHADLLGKRGSDGEPPPVEEIERLAAFRKVVEQELSSPHRLRDLAVDGNDLIELGFKPGPQLGRILHDLLDAVVDEPALNTRDQLLAQAKERL